MKRAVTFSVFFLTVLLLTRGYAQNNTGKLLTPGPQVTFTKGGPLAKVGALARVHAEYTAAVARGSAATFKSSNPLIRVHRGQVLVDVVAAGDASALRADLNALGLHKDATFGRVVSGWLPVGAIAKMAALDSLQFARPSYAITHVGLVTSQGDTTMRSDAARALFGVDGSGVTVGVLSDSFNQQGGAASDIASGDLPAGIAVLDDSAQCFDAFGFPASCLDEGRAMMHLIHDVAPGANLAFHTAFNGQGGFAAGILALKNIGAKVIVDDVIHLQEPMFQDGIIAQAVDQVKAEGVSYFSAAGNNGRDAYDSPFRSSGTAVLQAGGDAHDFNPGPNVDIFQRVTVPVGSGFIISFQWDSTFSSVSGTPGSPNDLDICVTTEPPLFLLACGGDFNIGNDPVEVFGFVNSGFFGTQFNIVIEKFNGVLNPGPNPGRMKYVRFDLGPGVTIDEYDAASPSIYGHASAAGAEAVGAVFYQETPEFGQNPPLLEPFSSAGPTPILFDTSGTPINETRQKPNIVAPDGTDTTFFPPFSIGGTDEEGNGFPNFFGTSAAAPHAAAVAALLLEAKSSLSPDEVYRFLRNTALDMGSPGVDGDSGFGFIQADAALLAALQGDPPPPPPTPQPALHVGDLDGSAKGGRSWNAKVTISLHDDSEKLIGGATVTGEWSNGVTGTSSCTTDRKGKCNVQSPQLSSNGTSVTFTVTGVSLSGYDYTSALNHDPDGDSNGTAIMVTR